MDFFLYSASILLGSAGARFIALYGCRLGIMDRPNKRSSHCEATPKGGGIGILLTFLLASAVIGIPATFWLAGGLIGLLSVFADGVELPPSLRLFFHFMVAAMLLSGKTEFLTGFLTGPGSWLLAAALAVYIVGTANFYNFMDGINGIAASTGCVAFALLSIFGLHAGADDEWIRLSLCLALACLGFLPYNVPKAQVFLGDVGSILLGFAFSGLVLQLSDSWFHFLCLSSFLLIFYADELSTMMVRLKDGENLTHPHRRHLYQLLANEMKIDHWKVSLAYSVSQLFVGVTALLLMHHGAIPVISFLGLCFAGFFWLSFNLRKRTKG